MLRYLLLLFFTACIIACKEPQSANSALIATTNIQQTEKLPIYVLKGVSPDSFSIKVQPNGNYDSLKSAINQNRMAFAAEYKKSNATMYTDSILKLASNYFTETLLNQIIPHWYGTTWDYNGYTDVPREGIIACGYFVSTTLKHMGLNLNRYKLAQAYSLKAVKVLQGSSAIDLSGKGAEGVISYLKEQGVDGFYVVGLDNHIGYLLKRKGQVFFIHSSYLHPGQVCIELARSAKAFIGHQAYMLAQLSGNEAFIKKWILAEEFIVPK